LRTARVAMTGQGPIRLTLDSEIRTAPAGAPRFSEPGSGTPLAGEPLILELKFRGPVPELFRELIDAFGLYQASISKYRSAAATLGLVRAATQPEAKELM